ncbi:chaperone [Synergistales bacterium]|nr:chaperone [Synergistales bacterium]
MDKDNEPIWLSSLKRQVSVKSGIILHGNVLDICYGNGRLEMPVIEVVTNALKQIGFENIIVWNQFFGAEDVPSEVWEAAQRDVMPNSSSSSSGTEYSMGDDNTQTPVSSVPTVTTRANIDDFLITLYRHMVTPKRGRYAFLVDWSQYLFGNANSLTADERSQLLALSKALRDATRSKLGDADLDNVVIFVTPKMGNIPPALYQGNNSIGEVVIPFPGRAEREDFLKGTYDKWQLKGNPQPGTPKFGDFVDATDGMSLRDMHQLLKMSKQQGSDLLSFEQLISLYKYGERKSPWEELDRSKLKTIAETLKKRVKGQDEAIEKVKSVIIRAFTGLSGLQHSKTQRMPKGVLFFVGPTGVGKTELAKSLAQFLFGDEEACVRFDMSEFNHEHSDQRLVGAPPGYVGYEEGGQLTNAVKRRPFSVLLFDEIEKAHTRILDKFLQILEDGRLTDGKGETVYFSETVIIFTSNIGASEVVMRDDKDEVKQEFLEKVQDHFRVTAKRPELLGRIGDNIVPFNFITSTGFLKAIAKAKLEPLREKLKEKYGITDVIFDSEEQSLEAIASAVDRSMGGRAVTNEIVKDIIDPLAEYLFNEVDDPSHCTGRKIIITQLNNKKPIFDFDLK